MSIRNALLALSAVVALGAIAAPAHSAVPTTFSYTIGGSIIGGSGLDSLSGLGIGSFNNSGEPTGLTFTVTGGGGLAGTYTELSASGTGATITETSGSELLTLSLLSGIPGFSNPFVGTGSKTGLYAITGSGVLGGGSSISVNISPVPLPGAVVLFGSAVVALGGFARLRRRKEV
jgi:hypothetical protein